MDWSQAGLRMVEARVRRLRGGRLVWVGGGDVMLGSFSSSPDPERPAAATSVQAAAAAYWGSLSAGKHCDY